MEQLRESINFPIQAMASDMTLAAFAQVHSEGYNVLFPFHDAIYIQAPSDEAESARDRLVEIMESQLPTPVHFRVEAKIGTSWAALG
jgi:DNA polymerase I-like protein with 3'-5' exonuclease and polymerase domains